MKRFLGVSCAIMLIVVGMAVTVVAQQMVPFPEPSTMVLIGASLIVLVALRRRIAHRKDDETADSR
jgi:hypothetical protein